MFLTGIYAGKVLQVLLGDIHAAMAHLARGITLSPLKQEVLEKLITLEIDETQIRPEDYRPYTTEHSQDCYVIGIIARPGIAEKYYASRLLHATLNYLIELLGIQELFPVPAAGEGHLMSTNHLSRCGNRSSWLSTTFIASLVSLTPV